MAQFLDYVVKGQRLSKVYTPIMVVTGVNVLVPCHLFKPPFSYIEAIPLKTIPSTVW